MLLVCGEALGFSNIVVELLDVTFPSSQLVSCHETVNPHGTIVTNVQIPGLPLEVDGAHRVADWPDLTLLRQPLSSKSRVSLILSMVFSKSRIFYPMLAWHRTTNLPDHELVVATAGVVVRVSGGEEVVRDVGADVVPLVSPLSLSGEAANVLHQTLRAGQFASAVGVALHVILATRPRPLRVPGDADVTHVVHVRALVALPCVRTPLVVIEVVPVALVVVVLPTEVLGRGKEREDGGDDERGLHLDVYRLEGARDA